MMGKRIQSAAILLSVMLALFSGISMPVQAEDGSFRAQKKLSDTIDTVTEAAGDIYRKMDEAVDSIDRESLRGQLRSALEELDRRGISPTVIAREKLGIKTDPTRGLATGITGDLLESAQRAVEQESRGSLQDLFDRILGGVSDFLGDVGALIGQHIPLPW